MRNPYVLPMLLHTKAGRFKDRRAPRGGARNVTAELEAEADPFNQGPDGCYQGICLACDCDLDDDGQAR